MDEESNYWAHEDTTLDELKEAAFEYLLLNPGSEFGDWRQGLIEQYATEVVDALGNNPDEVYSDLANLWESDYTDPNGVCMRFQEWAEALCCESSIEMYYQLSAAVRHYKSIFYEKYKLTKD